MPGFDAVARIIIDERDGLLADWTRSIATGTGTGTALRDPAAARDHARRFIDVLTSTLRQTPGTDVSSPAWADAREVLADVSRRLAQTGASPTETATFVFSMKEPLFTRLQAAGGDGIGDTLWAATLLIDGLGLFTMEAFQSSREAVIARQQQELLELSTPVVELWEGILALPLIGTLDSARTQVVMESLLHKVVETGAPIAIIDITGVPTVDTLVAQHLLKTVAAARLMGADCIISGIRPQIAQTIVHLGVDLSAVTTKATLADAFAVALRRSGREGELTRLAAAPRAAR